MRRYLEHMQSQEPHERRKHALHVAVVVTGLVFVGWVATLPMRINNSTLVAQEETSDQTAAVVEATRQTGPRLEVSTTSVYLPNYQQ